MNVVTLIGNLASDVDLREVGADKRVATFVLAVNRPTRDGEADFFRVCVWDRQAEACYEHLARGSHVAIDGRLRSRSWEADGKRRTSVEVVGNRVEFLSRPREAAERSDAEAPSARSSSSAPGE
jgi:single-strand DNA-binding protein